MSASSYECGLCYIGFHTRKEYRAHRATHRRADLARQTSTMDAQPTAEREARAKASIAAYLRSAR